MSSTTSPDLMLARRAAAGQPEAWDELIELYGRRIYNVAYQFAASREEAEDLTQEIFLKPLPEPVAVPGRRAAGRLGPETVTQSLHRSLSQDPSREALDVRLQRRS